MRQEATGKYQLLEPLTEEEAKALRADIAKRGVLIPVEKDQEGNILDGHHRQEYARELGKECPEVVRYFATEQEKREHVIKLNMARRHLDPVRWGKAFRMLWEERRTGIGANGATIAQLATEVGVKERTAKDRMKQAEDFDALPEPEKEKVRKKKATVRGAARKAKKEKAAAEIKAEPPPLPKGPFRVIIADPPWTYEGRADDTSHRSANPYPSMPLEEICAMRISGIAHEDCILWLWTTNAHMREAFTVLDAWGFEHKTILTWVKSKIGTGDWLRGKTEHCLLAVRGKPTVTLTNQSTALHGAARKHSEKPEEFYALVRKLCPAPNKGILELFQRTPREGIIGHGNEVQS